MQISFEKSKDGNDTCKINDIYIHSAYSPIKEAERFVSSIATTFLPEIIFVIEPGLSYCANFLRKRFCNEETRNAVSGEIGFAQIEKDDSNEISSGGIDSGVANSVPKIIAVRFCDRFKKYDNLFDAVINYFEYESSDIFENYLFNRFGEEKLSYSLFLAWEPSGKIFKNETIELFTSVKNIITKSHSVLGTRSFFEKRWIMNSVRFVLNFQKTVSLKKIGNCPVIICASGPSLKSAIPIIKQKSDCFIIAVSSAINPLIENDITPDLCISTDGGYWAKTHLKSLAKISDKTIFALAAEGSCNTKLIKNSIILPLTYSDGVESVLFSLTGAKSFQALRCGTVSGTALDLAIKLSSGNIYFCGLDLSLSNGFQHTQNNLIEKTNSVLDNKLVSSEKRNSVQGFSNQKSSLKIYEDWFKNFDTQNRNVYRIIDNTKNSLGKIKDISVSDFGNFAKKESGEKPIFTENTEIEKSKRVSEIKNFINKNSKSEKWLYNCFPIDYLNYTHNYDENQREGVYKKILSENDTLLCKIEKLCRKFTRK